MPSLKTLLSEALNPTIKSITRGQSAGGPVYGAVGDNYIVKLSDGSEVETTDDDLLDRYARLRTGGRKTIDQLNKLLIGKSWDVDI